MTCWTLKDQLALNDQTTCQPKLFEQDFNCSIGIGCVDTRGTWFRSANHLEHPNHSQHHVLMEPIPVLVPCSTLQVGAKYRPPE